MPDTFNPNEHLIQLSRKDYLPVAWRLVWLRTQEPNAHIETELLEHKPGEYAVVRARIALPAGAQSSGLGSETKSDFGDYLEKAETKAIGRALGALGFGTQFCGDEFDEGARIVDSPQSIRSPQPIVRRGQRPDPNVYDDQHDPPRSIPVNKDGEVLVTPGQVARMMALMKKHNFKQSDAISIIEQQTEALGREPFSIKTDELSETDADLLLEWLIETYGE